MTKKFKRILPIALLLVVATSLRFSEGLNEGNNNLENPVTYDEFIQRHLPAVKSEIDSGDIRKSRNLLYEVINNNIPLYWGGTPWDFNGTSQTPQEGTIACGYFLTTVMQQTGYSIERIHMAQQASSILIKSYCSDITYVKSVDALRKYLAEQPDSSTYLIGLDFHTGFITKNNEDLYFIHSNYIASRGVVKERITKSDALSSNEFFMIGSLDRRHDRLAQWMNW